MESTAVLIVVMAAMICAYTAWRGFSGKGFRVGRLTRRPRYTYTPGRFARYMIIAVCLAGLCYVLFRFAGMLKSN